MKEDINCTDGVLGEMNIRPGFREFVVSSIARFLVGDWGEIELEEELHNRRNPMAAVGAYTYRGEIKIYVKREGSLMCVFLPEEY